jgi:hypothetical protein
MTPERMYRNSERNFVLQQGLQDPTPEACPLQYAALLFQPRLVGLWAVAGVLLQSPHVFLALSAVLCWSAILPRLNPFDALYNRTLGVRRGALTLGPALAPRRFAQGMAAVFALAIAVALLFHARFVALAIEAFLLVAIAALVFGRFCLGSFVFHLLRGRTTFAKRTLPWVKSG